MHRTVVIALTASVVLALAAGPAAASCLFDDRPLPERLAEQPLVFVGTTTAIDDGGRAAEFAVEEVWRGEAGASVVVLGGPPSPAGVATSIDRFFAPNTRYLVAARSEDGRWISDSCMPTEEWDEQRHAQARPATASEPSTDALDGEPAGSGGSSTASSLALPLAIVAVVAVLGAGGFAVARRRDVV